MSSLFGSPSDGGREFAPSFIATYSSEGSCCGEIEEGDLIRADGRGGWEHIACSPIPSIFDDVCYSCFTVHVPGQRGCES